MENQKDFTPTGLKIEGAYENDRNAVSSDLFKAIIREAYGVRDVICGHHLVFERDEKRADGFTYQIIEEIPSADSLIFDHDVAKVIWGGRWKEVLTDLALEPVSTRDKLLTDLYRTRRPMTVAAA
jgi:hypothetical protein